MTTFPSHVIIIRHQSIRSGHLHLKSLPTIRWSEDDRAMGLLRASAAPLTGAALAGFLLYTCRESLSQRTHELTSSLHLSSRSLRRLAEVDDDALRKSPFGKQIQKDLQESEEEMLARIRSAYHAPSKPSLVEEVKSRWNVSSQFSCHPETGAQSDHALERSISLH